MTRAEAIGTIKCLVWHTRPDEEDVEQAIKALEQQPCDDCISRKAVLDALYSHKYSTEFCEEHHIDWSINLNMAHIVIKKLPSVTPKEKTGHWIYIGNNIINGLKIVECSSCGRRTYGSGNYCPNCGAKMIDLEESEVQDADSD